MSTSRNPTALSSVSGGSSHTSTRINRTAAHHQHLSEPSQTSLGSYILQGLGSSYRPKSTSFVSSQEALSASGAGEVSASYGRTGAAEASITTAPKWLNGSADVQPELGFYGNKTCLTACPNGNGAKACYDTCTNLAEQCWSDLNVWSSQSSAYQSSMVRKLNAGTTPVASLSFSTNSQSKSTFWTYNTTYIQSEFTSTEAGSNAAGTLGIGFTTFTVLNTACGSHCRSSLRYTISVSPRSLKHQFCQQSTYTLRRLRLGRPA